MQVNMVYRYYDMKRKNVGNPSFKLDPRIEDEVEGQQDILFFLHGKKDVNKTVKMINEMIPDPRFIALPIYSGVHPVFMMMMDAKPGYVSQLNFDKKDLELFTSGRSYPVKETAYKCIIYVATPMVEESITCIELRYVVDLGYQQAVDKKFQIVRLERKMINHQSRV